MKCELSYSINIENPDFRDVTESASRVIGFLRDHGVSDSTFLGCFELAAVEAFNNAVEHGCAAATAKFVRIKLLIRPDEVELRVTDPSDFTGWHHVPALPEDPLAEGGRGHFLMSQMTDELVHGVDESCHVLILRKRLQPGSWDYLPGQSDQVLSDMTDELVASYEMISTLLGLGE